jgi:hypothetical protein
LVAPFLFASYLPAKIDSICLKKTLIFKLTNTFVSLFGDTP